MGTPLPRGDQSRRGEAPPAWKSASAAATTWGGGW